tara:strand:+ start:385 stop:1152 length:768 start_codon:yes stop_codon:yes gene_type:complete
MANYDFPTEVIELPSKGKIYPESNPLSKGRVEIKYMTAKEEDILASQNLIKKGVVLDKLFESVVVDKDIDINDIIIGDKNAILLATRILGYGSEYQVEINDPFSGEQQRTTIDLAKIQTKEIDETLLSRDNLYEYELPKGKKKIKFKLLTHKDEKDITAEVQALQRLSKGKSDVTSDVTTRLKYMIQEVDGNGDRGFINNFVTNSLLALDTRSLRSFIKNISPDMDMKFDFTSNLTGDTETLDIPFGVSFFYPSE